MDQRSRMRIEKELLDSDIPVTVVFIKDNQDRRVMKCTLNRKLIPTLSTGRTTPDFPRDLNLIRVWDVKNHGWRSFHWNSVEESYIDDGEKTDWLYFNTGS